MRSHPNWIAFLEKKMGKFSIWKVWRRPCEVRPSKWRPGFSRAT